MDEIRIGEKTYISSKRAAEVTGYAKDYVGQLCREGHIEAKMVGRSWYVYEPSIREHRFGKETLQESEETQEMHGVSVSDSVQEPEAVLVDSPDPVADSAPQTDIEQKIEQWERPTYKPEPVFTIPAVQETQKVTSERPINALESEEYRHILEESSLTDMQKAWKEWFDHKQTRVDSAQQIKEERYEYANDNVDVDEVPADHIQHESAGLERPQQKEHKEEQGVISVPVHIYEPAEEPVQAAVEENDEYRVPVRKIATVTAQEDSEGRILHERLVQKHTFPTANTKKQLKHTKRSKSNGSGIVARAILLGISVVAIGAAIISSGVADQYVQTIPTENPASKIVDVLTGERTITNSN